MDWLKANAEWVFSGIGVLVISIVVSGAVWWWRRRMKPADRPLIVDTSRSTGHGVQPSPSTVATHTKEFSATRFFETRRLAVGDYTVFRTGSSDVRVDLKAILPNPKRTYPSDPEYLAEVMVDLGGAIIFGGSACNDVGVNRYQVPPVGHEEPSETLFAFSSSSKYLRFINVVVGHINPHAGVAEITVISIRKAIP